MFHWVGQEKVDVLHTVVVVNNRLCMFDLLHKDTVHSLLTLGKPVCYYREWFVLRFSACLRNHRILRFYAVCLSCVITQMKKIFFTLSACAHIFACIYFCILRLFELVKKKTKLENGIVTNESDLLYFHLFLFYSISHEKLFLSVANCSC